MFKTFIATLAALFLTTSAFAGNLLEVIPTKFQNQAQACYQEAMDDNLFSSLVAVYTVRTPQFVGNAMRFTIDDAPAMPLKVTLRTDADQQRDLNTALRNGTAFVLFTRPGDGDPTDPERQTPQGTVLDYTVVIATPTRWGDECTYVSAPTAMPQAQHAQLPPVLKTLVTGLKAATACGAAYVAEQFIPGTIFYMVTEASYANKKLTFRLGNMEGTISTTILEDIDYLADGAFQRSVERNLVIARVIPFPDLATSTYNVEIAFSAILYPENTDKAWQCENLGSIRVQGIPLEELQF